MGDSKFDRNQFHPLSLFLLLATTSDSAQYILYRGIRCEDRIGFQPTRNSSITHSNLNQRQIDSRYKSYGEFTGNTVK